MHRVRLTYTLAGPGAPREAPGPDLHHPLGAMLAAVHDTGSISGAARQLDLSYRHVWGELKRWEVELGHALVTWVKGQPAVLAAVRAGTPERFDGAMAAVLTLRELKLQTTSRFMPEGAEVALADSLGRVFAATNPRAFGAPRPGWRDSAARAPAIALAAAAARRHARERRPRRPCPAARGRRAHRRWG